MLAHLTVYSLSSILVPTSVLLSALIYDSEFRGIAYRLQPLFQQVLVVAVPSRTEPNIKDSELPGLRTNAEKTSHERSFESIKTADSLDEDRSYTLRGHLPLEQFHYFLGNLSVDWFSANLAEILEL